MMTLYHRMELIDGHEFKSQNYMLKWELNVPVTLVTTFKTKGGSQETHDVNKFYHYSFGSNDDELY